MSDINVLKNAIEEVRYNPIAIQRVVMDTLDQATQGQIELVDPSNPFVFLMEAAAVSTSAAMSQSEALVRQLYPSLAVTEDELYLHMSDQDYLGRFAQPSRTVFTLLFDKRELMEKSVPTGIGGTRQLVVPRNTEFTIAEHTFSMQYPIDIRVLSHGGIQVVYDNSRTSPLKVIESNIINWDIIRIHQTDYVKIEVPVEQFKLTSYIGQLNLSSGFNQTYEFEDHFYYTRVFHSNGEGGWTEIKTTHTQQVFDPFDPTVVLKVYHDRVNVHVPQIYITNELLNRELRIDIYTTKGPLELILDGYEINAFGAHWWDVEKEELTAYSAPLATFSNMAVYSDSVVTGGRLSLDFLSLRERVITNALGQQNLPITDVQLNNQLNNLGYHSIKDVDHVTNRIYLASKRIPTPKNDPYIAPAGSLIATLQDTTTALTQQDGVVDNGNRITITNKGLYTRQGGVVRPLTRLQREHVAQLDDVAMVESLNTQPYLFCPFYYVLDFKEDYFVSRAYHLDNPKITYREFIQENESAGLHIATDQLSIQKHQGTYTLRLLTDSDDVIKEMPDDNVHVVIGFRPVGQEHYVYTWGQFIGIDPDTQERYFECAIQTNYDIDENHFISLSNFTATIEPPRRVYSTPLEARFEIFYVVENYRPAPGQVFHPLRFEENHPLPIDARYTSVMHERIGVSLGEYLEGFWDNARSIVSPADYARHADDVPAIYEENVYRRDPTTGRILVDEDFEDLTPIQDHIDDRHAHSVTKHQIGLGLVENDVFLKVMCVNEIVQEEYTPPTYQEVQDYITEQLRLRAEREAARERIYEPRLTYKILHHKGDPVLDEKGNPVYLHRKGDPILDENGNPIISSHRNILREIDLFFIDAKYYFVNHPEDITYRENIKNTITRWVLDDVNTFRQWAIEQTQIYFYPQRTIGMVPVRVRDNEQINAELEQYFKITYYMARDKYHNTQVRDNLTTLATQVISTHLSKKRISISDITAEIRERVADEAIALRVEGLGGEGNLTTLTLDRDIERLSIRKKMQLSIDNLREVVDDIQVTFVAHEGEY